MEAKTLSESSEEPQPESDHARPVQGRTGQTTTEPVVLPQVLALWDDGAVKQFVSIQWNGPFVFRDLPVLNVSEEQLASLPEHDVKRIALETLELVEKMRSLARHVLATGDDLVVAGDTTTATAHYQAVLQCGEALSGPDRTVVVQMVGEALEGTARRKLSAPN